MPWRVGVSGQIPCVGRLNRSAAAAGELLRAGDRDQAGLLEEGEVVLQVPVLIDPGAGADVLDVEGVEVDGLTVALDAVVGAGEVAPEDQVRGEGVTGDVELGHLAGQVGYRRAEPGRGD